MQDKVQILKVIGAGAIILAAVLIMLPGIMDYLGSLSRLATWVIVACIVAGSCGYITTRLRKSKTDENESK